MEFKLDEEEVKEGVFLQTGSAAKDEIANSDWKWE